MGTRRPGVEHSSAQSALVSEQGYTYTMWTPMDGQNMDTTYNLWYNTGQYSTGGWHGSYYHPHHHQQQQQQQQHSVTHHPSAMSNSQTHCPGEPSYYQGYGYIYNTYVPPDHMVSTVCLNEIHGDRSSRSLAYVYFKVQNTPGFYNLTLTNFCTLKNL